MFYHKWLEIEVTHPFFTNGICPVLTLQPFSKTAGILKSYNILVKKRDNIFSFYVGTEGDSFAIVSDFADLGTLSFQVHSTDSYFFNYTEIPFIGRPNLFLFQNAEGSFQLQKGPYVSEDDIFDSTLTEFDSEIQQGCLGILNLNIKHILKTPFEFSRLTLQFKAREVYWQYKIIIPDNQNMDVTESIISGMTLETYGGPVKEQTVGGQTANVYTSSIPLQFQQQFQAKPQLHLKYTNTLTGKSDTLDLTLPSAGVETLNSYTNNEGIASLCATIIIYV